MELVGYFLRVRADFKIQNKNSALNMIWESESKGMLNGVPVQYVNRDFEKHRTTSKEIIVLKPKKYFDKYCELLRAIDTEKLNIIELGIFEGGSSLILADCFPLARILAFDLRDSNPCVEDHVRDMGYGRRIKLNYRVSQTDEQSLLKSAYEFFESEPIHVVIDDASHHYGKTRESFEILFPLLAKGGLFIVEDWAWAHWNSSAYDDWPGIALSSLVLEFAMGVGSRHDKFSKIEVYPEMAIVTKGVCPSRERMDLSSLIKTAPRNWKPLTLGFGT